MIQNLKVRAVRTDCFYLQHATYILSDMDYFMQRIKQMLKVHVSISVFFRHLEKTLGEAVDAKVTLVSLFCHHP